jgi:hypothetical protein
LNNDVRISLWSARVGRDALLGRATVACDFDGDQTWVKKTVDLEGEVAGRLDIELRRRPEFETLRDSMSLAKRLGSGPIGEWFPMVRQLGTEISMLDTSLATLQLFMRKEIPQLQYDMKPGPFIPGISRVGEVLLTLQNQFAGSVRPHSNC